MVRRATEGTGEAAYQRLAMRTEKAQAAANERVEALFDNMLGEVRALRGDVQGISQNQGAVERRMDDLELQINMTRDEVQRRAINPAPSQIASAKVAIRDAAKSPWGKTVAAAIGFVAIVSALNNTPDAVRAAERFWALLAGRDVKALEVVVPPAPNPPLSEK